MEKTSWTDRVKNKVLQTVKDDRHVLTNNKRKEGRLTGIVTYCEGTAL